MADDGGYSRGVAPPRALMLIGMRPLLPAEHGSGHALRSPGFATLHWLCVQKAAEYQVGGGNELNRVTYISQVGWQPSLAQPGLPDPAWLSDVRRRSDCSCWVACKLPARTHLPATLAAPRACRPCQPHACDPVLPPSTTPQVKARPPTFVAFVSGSTPLSTATTRFLAAQIRKQFGFSGVPLRITVRMKQPRGRRAEQQQQQRGGGSGKRRRR